MRPTRGGGRACPCSHSLIQCLLDRVATEALGRPPIVPGRVPSWAGLCLITRWPARIVELLKGGLNTVSQRPLIEIFDILYSTYGPQGWWPGHSPFEVMVGAVLTQNTAWRNVAVAIDNLKSEGLLDAHALLREDPARVKSLIAPVGFFNVKYDRLKALLEYLAEHGVDNDRFRSLPIADLRGELLAIHGIGPETADSILLYAFERPVFVVDAYTRRLFARLGEGWMEKAPYEEVQRFFVDGLRRDAALYNEFHALIVAHCKSTCKRDPLCAQCCLSSLCADRE